MKKSKFIKKGLVVGIIFLFLFSSIAPIVSASGGPMDSPWPMYCHDTRHTGRSPYSTANNPGIEKWRFDTGTETDGNVAVDDNGVVYIGANGIYAVHPNGTLKWNYITHLKVHGAPAIDENGII